jgi:L-xylulokinase
LDVNYYLGLDSGLTVTKAVLFDERGHEVATAARTSDVSSPAPGWQERDMDALWRMSADAIRACVSTSGIDSRDIATVGLSGHSDGVYAIDGAGNPVRPAISATDSRALKYVRAYRDSGAADRALALTGQSPFAASPASLYAWLRDYEPQTVERARWFLGCKDWLRFRLTGEIATDLTEASVSFTDVNTQSYSPAALQLYGLEAVADKLPRLVESHTVAGVVSPAAANDTGLREGTPVAAGAHDCDATALALGAIQPGTFSVVMGTFSINQVVANAVRLDHRWQARSFLHKGRWLHMSTSPSSASNLAWLVNLLGPWRDGDQADFALAIRQGLAVDPARAPLFRPFLYGSPDGTVGAAFTGLLGQHGRDEMLRAVLDGVVFNHRVHLDALREQFSVAGAVRLAGGGARSEGWAQLLSDTTGLPTEVTDVAEVGAKGAAMLGAIGIGVFANTEEAVQATVRITRAHDPIRRQSLEDRYRSYLQLAAGHVPAS